jgi:hypothetical protein
MARARAKKAATKPDRPQEPEQAPVPATREPLDPRRAHELLGLPGPYDPPALPVTTKGFTTWWDPGISINELRRRQKSLFVACDWLDGQRFAKDSDSWKWRLLRLDAAEPGQVFEEQARKIGRGDEPPTARELVTYLVLHFLATGQRLEIPRLRCRDVLPSGRRVCVGPFRESGLEIANVSDLWKSPGIGLASSYTPAVPKKK